jgi:hypothetical protein
MSSDNSGPAFPTGTWEYDGQGNVLPYQQGGMTLRDYFAAKAMAAYVSVHIAHYGHDNCWPIDSLSSEAYSVADAMLKAREAV